MVLGDQKTLPPLPPAPVPSNPAANVASTSGIQHRCAGASASRGTGKGKGRGRGGGKGSYAKGWYDFRYSQHVPLHRLEAELRAALAIPSAEMEVRRRRMLWHLPYVSWSLARRTTAMYVLVQAAMKVRGVAVF